MMLSFSNLCTLVGLLGTVVPLIQAKDENVVLIKTGGEPDHPIILLGGKELTAVSFYPIKGKKKTWDWEGADGDPRERISDGAAFTIRLGKGMGERKCHLERETHAFGPYAVTIRNDASYLSVWDGDRVEVVCGVTEPGMGGDEKSTCSPW